MPGSLTRRQLLIRTGGASVALACFGVLPGGAVADSVALTPARAATYAALLDAIDADPAYALGQREHLVAGFADAYVTDESVRRYADPVLDALAPLSSLPPHEAHAALADLDGRVKPDALSLAALAFDLPEDTHTIVFTV
ncbi:hypothetical protein OM076_24510 [Solirubrobacter ginsenosidimutans]|uniref:Uncharacterized protein n=1 Tax=Solirubrobacter ginsenosidimutans TaxID=490573 RepID=A0A9X3MVF6_9ACTN|nr:hypothetical protein [Solirubrobacter ginsenosidimutans]MDA0163459.1 hypothetical protein [Solirubrobacter ginsenosidimutans]